jgi:hypothetical protein
MAFSGIELSLKLCHLFFNELFSDHKGQTTKNTKLEPHKNTKIREGTKIHEGMNTYDAADIHEA